MFLTNFGEFVGFDYLFKDFTAALIMHAIEPSSDEMLIMVRIAVKRFARGPVVIDAAAPDPNITEAIPNKNA
jgi:hypothetical protein